MNKKLEIAKAVNMIGAKRHVNIRGYVCEVEVLRELDAKKWGGRYFRVMTQYNREEIVPEHLFYHETLSGLIMRDEPEFKRLYGGHPIEVVKVPSL